MKTLFVLISLLSITAFADYRGHDQDIAIIKADAQIQEIFSGLNEIVEIVPSSSRPRAYYVNSHLCQASVEIQTVCRPTVPRHNELDECIDQVIVTDLFCPSDERE